MEEINVTMKQTVLLFLATTLIYGCTPNNMLKAEQITMEKIYITIDGETHTITLENNQAAKELTSKLQNGPVTVTLNSSGNFEIWGALGFSLTASDRQITAKPGDVILYNSSNICLLYGSNSWSYTRIGRIEEMTESELRTFLKAGENGITVTLSLDGTTGIKGVSYISNQKEDEDYYTLSGKRVKNASKGIYIKNGKKILL